MPLFFPTIDEPARQPTCCQGCGCDLGARTAWAIFCPNCGRRLKAEETVRSRLARAGSHALHCFGFGRANRGVDAASAVAQAEASRSPMVLGYGNALYTLGWRYERGTGPFANRPEAMRCYRKSARLGNVDATVRLATLTDEPPPKPVIPL